MSSTNEIQTFRCDQCRQSFLTVEAYKGHFSTEVCDYSNSGSYSHDGESI